MSSLEFQSPQMKENELTYVRKTSRDEGHITSNIGKYVDIQKCDS